MGAGLALVVSFAAVAEPPGVWLDVPFVKQPRNGCAAACVAMVEDYWRGKGAACQLGDVADIDHRLYSSSAKGIRASDMEQYLENAGFRVFAFRGTPADLRDHLAEGRPLIVALKEGRRTFHDVVVVGFDQDGSILVNDPAERKLLKMDWREFERRWEGAKTWTLLALPRQRLLAHATELGK